MNLTPSRTKEYASYLIGLGFGVILGSITAADKFPTPIVTAGFILVAAALGVNFWSKK